MISHYKLKIISWYTILLAGILAVVLIFVYSILNYQLREEVNNSIREKAERVSLCLLNTDSTLQCDERFLNHIVGRGHLNFYNIRENTDINDKYILIAYSADSLMYVSSNYKNLGPFIKKFNIRENTIPAIKLSDIPFGMTAVYRNGYAIYIGYELSFIYSLQKRLLVIFFTVFPFGVFLSVLCGILATRKSLNIIKSITGTASRITSKNLNERIQIPSGKDEISELVVTLNSMIDRLEKSFTMVQQFSQDAAHEIRTPLTIVRGEIEELLNKDKCPENISIILENILEEMQCLSSTANKLLLTHRLDTGKIKYHFKKVGLNRIINEVFQDAKILASEKKLKLRLENSSPVFVSGNEELLTRLLWNIIDNAIKYTCEKGEINIILEKIENCALVNVKDTGIGISVEEIPKIFDRFYRVDKSRSRELGGSGLGLAICKWIVELHKGEIQVESTINKGSCFSIIIPVDSDSKNI